MTINLRDFRPESVGALFKNMFCKNWPHGGAGGPCEKSGCQGVCAKFGMDRGNDGRDMSRAKV